MTEVDNATEESLKKITSGSVVWGGCVVHFTEDFTAYDFYLWQKESTLQFDPRTATGQHLRNLADYSGVEYGPEDSDAEVRRLYFEEMNGVGT